MYSYYINIYIYIYLVINSILEYDFNIIINSVGSYFTFVLVKINLV